MTKKNDKNEVAEQFASFDDFLNKSMTPISHSADKFFTLASLFFVPLFILSAWVTHEMVFATLLGLFLSVLVTLLVSPKNTLSFFKNMKQKRTE